MGKRSNFKRRRNDLYRTPASPVIDLMPHLPRTFRFCEPCAADGTLIDHLRRIGGTCEAALDINPGRGDVRQGNALRWVHTHRYLRRADYIITNPPWSRELLHPLIRRFCWQMPTWLLFDADWIHTKQAIDYIPMLRKIVSVGRVKWIENSASTGKDNCCWYLFDANNTTPTQFIGRRP